MRKHDLTGQEFGFLKVLGDHKIRDAKGTSKVLWDCVCVCGEKRSVIGSALLAGKHKSCGCKQAELRSIANTRHGKSQASEYRTWGAMKKRCLDPNSVDYPAYGGRGIKIHPSWMTPENFFRDMGPRPQGCSLDRINNDGNYEPGNCRWATPTEQSRNRRSNIYFELREFKGTLKAITTHFGSNYVRAWRRLKRGWTLEQAVFGQ
jgi:hypothetical protein